MNKILALVFSSLLIAAAAQANESAAEAKDAVKAETAS